MVSFATNKWFLQRFIFRNFLVKLPDPIRRQPEDFSPSEGADQADYVEGQSKLEVLNVCKLYHSHQDINALRVDCNFKRNI